MCETGSDTFTDYELFSRSGLGAYMGDEEAMKAFIFDNQEDNIYQDFRSGCLEVSRSKGFST